MTTMSEHPPQIPLAKALIAWNPMWRVTPNGGSPGQIDVCQHPDNGQLRHLGSWAMPSHIYFGRDETKEELVLKLNLLLDAWHIACRDEIPLEAIHSALKKIPEYNEMLSEDFKVNKQAI